MPRCRAALAGPELCHEMCGKECSHASLLSSRAVLSPRPAVCRTPAVCQPHPLGEDRSWPSSMSSPKASSGEWKMGEWHFYGGLFYYCPCYPGICWLWWWDMQTCSGDIKHVGYFRHPTPWWLKKLLFPALRFIYHNCINCCNSLVGVIVNCI